MPPRRTLPENTNPDGLNGMRSASRPALGSLSDSRVRLIAEAAMTVETETGNEPGTPAPVLRTGRLTWSSRLRPQTIQTRPPRTTDLAQAQVRNPMPILWIPKRIKPTSASQARAEWILNTAAAASATESSPLDAS